MDDFECTKELSQKYYYWYYTSSVFNPSLGDLLLNIIFLLSLIGYIFRYYSQSATFQRIMKLNPRWKAAVSTFLILFAHYGLFLQFMIIRSFYDNSTWSMDITAEIEFPFLKVLCFLIFLLAVSCYFLLAHVIYSVVEKLNKGNNIGLVSSFATGVFIYMILSKVAGDPFFLIAVINLFYFSIIALLDLRPPIWHIQ